MANQNGALIPGTGSRTSYSLLGCLQQMPNYSNRIVKGQGRGSIMTRPQPTAWFDSLSELVVTIHSTVPQWKIVSIP